MVTDFVMEKSVRQIVWAIIMMQKDAIFIVMLAKIVLIAGKN